MRRRRRIRKEVYVGEEQEVEEEQHKVEEEQHEEE